MNLKEKYNGIRQEVKALMGANPDGMSKEVTEKVNGLLAQADELKGQIELAERAADMADYDKPAGSAARSGWSAAARGAGEEVVDEKSWRETEYTTYNIRHGIVTPEKKTFRWYVPERINTKEYAFAIEAYTRKGEKGMTERELKTLREGVDNEGGYLVAPDMQERILTRMASMATIRNYADVITTARDSVVLPRINGNSDVYPTTARGTWAGELPAAGAVRTNMTFGQVNIPVNTLMAEMLVSNNLLEDTGVDLADRLANYFGETFAVDEDYAFINGTGVARPRGILLDVDGTNGVASVDSGASSTLTYDGLVDLEAALPEQYEQNARFFMSKNTMGAVRKLKDGAGTYVLPVYANGGGLGANPQELLGYGLVRDANVPSVAANAYPIIFGDMFGYTVVDRVGISIQRLVEKYADQNITGFLARKRVGGQLSAPERLRVQKVSS